jgi:hypothetical protein
MGSPDREAPAEGSATTTAAAELPLDNTERHGQIHFIAGSGQSFTEPASAIPPHPLGSEVRLAPPEGE